MMLLKKRFLLRSYVKIQMVKRLISGIIIEKTNGKDERVFERKISTFYKIVLKHTSG